MNRKDIPQFSLAFVTGASSGIGEAVANLLAEKGIDLIIHGRNIENLQKVQQDISSKIKVETILADLAKPLERQKVIEVIRSRKPDLIINNAGFGLYGSAVSFETSQQMEILEVNSNAVLELTLEAAKTLIAAGKKGVILNVASSAGELPLSPGFAVYSAAKACVNHLSQSLDMELQPSGIRVLAAAPGYVDTNFSKRAGGKRMPPHIQKLVMSPRYAAEEIWKQIEKGIPLHVFDFKTKFLITLAKLVPKKWLASVMHEFNKERTSQK